MVILRFIQCIFQGHATADITANRHAYRYCLRCGRVESQALALADQRLQPEK